MNFWSFDINLAPFESFLDTEIAAKIADLSVEQGPRKLEKREF